EIGEDQARRGRREGSFEMSHERVPLRPPLRSDDDVGGVAVEGGRSGDWERAHLRDPGDRAAIRMCGSSKVPYIGILKLARSPRLARDRAGTDPFGSDGKCGGNAQG